MKGVRKLDASFEVRVKGGGYTVESPVAPAGKKAGQQHIPTVTNSGGFYKCGQALRRLVTSGSMKQATETKVIMSDVNLVLEEGKMYLILGAPGCGKVSVGCFCMSFSLAR